MFTPTQNRQPGYGSMGWQDMVRNPPVPQQPAVKQGMKEPPMVYGKGVKYTYKSNKPPQPVYPPYAQPLAQVQDQMRQQVNPMQRPTYAVDTAQRPVRPEVLGATTQQPANSYQPSTTMGGYYQQLNQVNNQLDQINRRGQPAQPPPPPVQPQRPNAFMQFLMNLFR